MRTPSTSKHEIYQRFSVFVGYCCLPGPGSTTLVSWFVDISFCAARSWISGHHHVKLPKRLFVKRSERRLGKTLHKQGWQFPTKKLFRRRRNRWNNWFVPAEFLLFRGTENSRNSVLNHSAEEKTTRNSVPWNKNISNHFEFCSEPFRGRDNNSKFRSEACLRRQHAVNSVCWSRIFL